MGILDKRSNLQGRKAVIIGGVTSEAIFTDISREITLSSLRPEINQGLALIGGPAQRFECIR
jgi:hypothetical protein